METKDGTTVVAYDLNTNAGDNVKSNTAPTLTGADLALNGEDNGHTLFLNSFMTTPYARSVLPAITTLICLTMTM